MQFNPTSSLSRFIGRRDGRRVPGRLAQEMLTSNLGPVIDLSTGGMRVLSTRPPAPELEVEVHLSSGTVSVSLRARIAWCRRLGFRRHEIGLTFLDVDEDAARVLTRISSDHRAQVAVPA